MPTTFIPTTTTLNDVFESIAIYLFHFIIILFKFESVYDQE